MTTGSTTFTGTDGAELTTVDANWTVNNGAFVIQDAGGGVIGIVSNTLNTGCLARYAGTWGADQWSEVTLYDPTGGGTIGAAVRVAASGQTGYTAEIGSAANDTLYVSKYVSGTYSDLRTVELAIAAGDRLRIEVTGTSTASIKIYLNDVQQGTTITDSSSPITSGSPGIGGYSNLQYCIASEWSAEDIGAASIVPPTTRLSCLGVG